MGDASPCRKKPGTPSPRPHPTTPLSGGEFVQATPEKKAAPRPVEEKMELGRAGPVQQSAPPAPSSQPPPLMMKEQPTTHAAPPPPPPHSDDENGWIIPLDQLSADELDQPDVQISRL